MLHQYLTDNSKFAASMKFFDLNKPIWQILLLLFLAVIWGSSFILMKRGLESFNNFQVASLRIIIAFIALLPILIRNFKKISKSQWLPLFAAGMLGAVFPAFLFTTAQTQLSSSLTGMLNSLVPLFTVVIGIIFFKMPVRLLKILGVGIGLLGAFGLILGQNSLAGGDEYSLPMRSIPYALLVVLATVSYATNVNFIKRFLKNVSAVNITAFGFLIPSPLALIYLFTTDFTDRLTQDPSAPLNLAYVAILAIFGTSLAVILFNLLIKKVSPVFASSVTYIIPIFAMIWGLIDGETVSLIQILSIFVILFGVFIVNCDNIKEKKEQKEALPYQADTVSEKE